VTQNLHFDEFAAGMSPAKACRREQTRLFDFMIPRRLTGGVSKRAYAPGVLFSFLFPFIFLLSSFSLSLSLDDTARRRKNKEKEKE
jgi:hypothetical protein